MIKTVEHFTHDIVDGDHYAVEMPLPHDTALSLHSATALVNTAQPEALNSLADLDAFCHAYRFTGSRRRTHAELRDVRETRMALRFMLLAPEARSVAAANRVLREARAIPQLVDHDGLGWHLHAVADEAPLATRILVETAMAMTELHRVGERERITACAAVECDRLVLDLSRNRSRRFCSAACGNRMAVARYRRTSRPQRA